MKTCNEKNEHTSPDVIVVNASKTDVDISFTSQFFMRYARAECSSKKLRCINYKMDEDHRE